MKRPPLYVFFDWIRFRWWFGQLYRVELAGREQIPPQGPAILVANHESMIDPWLLGLVTPRPIRFMAKAELWSYPVTRCVMEGSATFPVSRGLGDRGAVGRARRAAGAGRGARHVPAGHVPPVPPSARGCAARRGSRSRRARRSSPMCIVGSEKALRPGKFKVGLPRIHVLVGEPIEVEPGTPDGRGARRTLTARVEEAIEAAREPYGPPAHAWFPDERVA